MFKYKFLIIILFYQFILIFTQNLTTIDSSTTSSILPSSKLSDHNDSSCRNLFFVVSLSSLFIYLVIIVIVDFLSKEHLPEIYPTKSKEKQSIILSKYLVRLVFGKWSSNFEFSNNILLNFQLNSYDPKVQTIQFSIPTEWLKTLMDFVGTKENPFLKSIKFWVYQPDSLGLISSLKINLKDFKNLNLLIYLESIEFSKISDNKIQVINIRKNIKFVNSNPIQLNTELGFKPNTRINAYDGYSPYFIFTDYLYFYLIYLDSSFLILNSLNFKWLSDLNSETFNFKRILFNSFIKSIFCAVFIVPISSFYLFCMKLKLSKRHNSDKMQILNIIFLSGLFLFIFVLNYLFCDTDQNHNFKLRKSNFLVELAIMQLFSFFTFTLLWLLSNLSKLLSIKKMIFKSTDLIDLQTIATSRLSSSLNEKIDSNLFSMISKRQSGTETKTISLHPKSNKILSKRIQTIPTVKQPLLPLPNLTKINSLPAKEESPLRRVDSDNSIGSGYYHQMITATKHVRSISQYGELLRDNKN